MTKSEAGLLGNLVILKLIDLEGKLLSSRLYCAGWQYGGWV